MTIKIQHKRSAVKGKAPLPADLEYGEIAVNYEAGDPAFYIKDSANVIRRIGNQPGSLVFKGSLAPTAPAPTAPEAGHVYVMSAPGTMAASWIGMAGKAVVQSENIAWDGTEWESLGDTHVDPPTIATTSDTAPANPKDGDLWYDSVSGELYCFYDSDDAGAVAGTWVQANPQPTPKQATASVAGVDVKLWKKTGTTLETETANDSVSLGGKLLVGTTTGGHLVTIANAAAPATSDTDGGGALLELKKKNFVAGSQTAHMMRISSGSDAQLALGTLTDAGGSPFSFIDTPVGAGMVFRTLGTERMRINSNGTASIYSVGDPALGVRSSRAATSIDTIIAGYHSATSTFDGTLSFRVYTNGNVQNTNNSYAGLSDLKLKENIVDANSQWDDLKALQVRNYNFKEGQTHTQIGLIAQEVELVSPGLVIESPDRDTEGNDLGTVTKSVNYSVLYMKAVKALQEAMERIETLETRITTLEARP